MTLDLMAGAKEVDKKPKSMTLKELKAAIEIERKLVNSEVERYRTEYWRKITWSFSPFIFILFGFPLAVITNRRAKSANVTIAILAATFYYLISMGCESLSLKGIAPAELIMWLPNTIGLLAAIILNIKCVS